MSSTEVIMGRIGWHICHIFSVASEVVTVLKDSTFPLRPPEHQAVKTKSLFRGRKLFWLSVGYRFNWNLMCGMWNYGSLEPSQESTECAGFSFSLSLSLSSPLPVSLFHSLCLSSCGPAVSYISPVNCGEGWQRQTNSAPPGLTLEWPTGSFKQMIQGDKTS